MDKQLIERVAGEGIELDYREETTSTNDTAREADYPSGAVVMAERQSAGRGQRGNRWESPEGVNLTFSVVLHPDFLEADRQFHISRVVALALADMLETFGLDARIKWPNDIYVGDRKIVGILIENDLMGTVISRSIAGIGINVNQLRFDPSLPNPTSLRTETGVQADRAEVFVRFYRALARRYDMLAEGEFARLEADYLARLYRFGERHRYRNETGETFLGTIVGVAPAGELNVLHENDSTVRSYLFKEIEYLTGE